MISAYCLVGRGVDLFFPLHLLTVVLVLEEVDWAGVEGLDQHHLVAPHPSHLQQDGDNTDNVEKALKAA